MGSVSAPTIHQYLNPVAPIVTATVVGGQRCVALKRGGRLKAGNQPKQVREVPRTRSTDQVAVNDGDSPGCFVESLRQTRNRQHDGHVCQEIAFGSTQWLGSGTVGKRSTPRAH